MSELTQKIEQATRTPFFDQTGRSEGKTHGLRACKIRGELSAQCSWDKAAPYGKLREPRDKERN